MQDVNSRTLSRALTALLEDGVLSQPSHGLDQSICPAALSKPAFLTESFHLIRLNVVLLVAGVSSRQGRDINWPVTQGTNLS